MEDCMCATFECRIRDVLLFFPKVHRVNDRNSCVSSFSRCVLSLLFRTTEERKC